MYEIPQFCLICNSIFSFSFNFSPLFVTFFLSFLFWPTWIYAKQKTTEMKCNIETAWCILCPWFLSVTTCNISNNIHALQIKNNSSHCWHSFPSFKLGRELLLKWTNWCETFFIILHCRIKFASVVFPYEVSSFSSEKVHRRFISTEKWSSMDQFFYPITISSKNKFRTRSKQNEMCLIQLPFPVWAQYN